MTTRPVFRTDASTVSTSSGRIDRRSTTSTLTPSPAACSAASSARATITEVATTVTSDPSRFTSAAPSGTVYGSSGTSPFVRYSSLCSTKITGLSSRMLASNSPFASAGVAGATTFSPGTCANQASRLSECCAAAPVPDPAGVRRTIGTRAFPPNMYRTLAPCSTSCSMHSVMKSMN